MNVTLTGTNLSNVAGISVSGTGIAVSIVGRTNTVLDLVFTIDLLAELGPRTITISTPGGIASIGFTVTAPQ